MPKRSNDFQKLVYLVRLNLAAGATVTESKMLPDLLTHRKREVDVCVEGHVGGHGVKVCIECRDHKRPSDVGWVDAMKAKHERLPTHALILVSRSGFTNEARDVAQRYGIEALALEEVEQADFQALLGATGSLWNKSVTLTAQKVIVRVVATPTLEAENVAVMPDNLVYASDGTELGPIAQLVQLMLYRPEAQRRFLSEGKQEHVWFELRWQPPRDTHGNPLFLKKLDPLLLREIEHITIKGPSQFRIEEFRLRRGTLGNIHLAWGKTDIFGKDALVVATRDEAGVEKFSFTLTGAPPEAK
jgi:hypothetical protein